jgi:hypothetical protein
MVYPAAPKGALLLKTMMETPAARGATERRMRHERDPLDELQLSRVTRETTATRRRTSRA